VVSLRHAAAALLIAALALGAAAAGSASGSAPVAKISLGGRGGIVAPAGGSLWVTDTALNRLLRIDPATNTITARIGAGIRPLGIA
jgi:YVTN family beta-propeller protein